MNPPTWLDERGQPRPKRPCPVCGREILLKSYGWQPWQLSSVVEWCGHRIEEGIPVPDVDGRWRLRSRGRRTSVGIDAASQSLDGVRES